MRNKEKILQQPVVEVLTMLTALLRHTFCNFFFAILTVMVTEKCFLIIGPSLVL